MKKAEISRLKSQLQKIKIANEKEDSEAMRAFWDGYISELEAAIKKYEEESDEEE